MNVVMTSRLALAVMATPEVGAAPLIRRATVADPTPSNGVYHNRMTPEEPKNRYATDPGLAQRLWDVSRELVDIATKAASPVTEGKGDVEQ